MGAAHNESGVSTTAENADDLRLRSENFALSVLEGSGLLPPTAGSWGASTVAQMLDK